ncbi:MAG: exodeoxyribonuclease VII large subunit [Bacteroidales bacterium]
MEDKISLLELQEQIKKGVEKSVPERVWVTAEISEINNNVSGHCYMDLVDYKEGEKGIAAKARGIIWSSAYRVIKPYFETTTGAMLSTGMHVLLKVQVQYSQIYGISLVVFDIDPSFTIGEFELKRQKTIKRLKDEGCFNVNSQLELPIIPRKFAIISSITAAGYRDFEKHLHNNEYGFSFYTQLFQAQMQGDDSPQSIISALDKIACAIEETADFDAVLIIRGGGSAMDLSCFDDYDLAINIAQFPIPVITGVGHDHNYHICDMVAHTWLKTPTAVADFILDIFMQEDARLSSLFQRISLALSIKINIEEQGLKRFSDRFKKASTEAIKERERQLETFTLRLNGSNPASILAKGFVIASVNGKHAIEIDDIKEGEKMSLIMRNGIVEFTIGEIINKKIDNL